jgi:geranylgeranyl pyrophosphate synthase
MPQLQESLQIFAAEFDRRLDQFLPPCADHSRLAEAMRYSVLAPGKRIRPFLVIRCCELVGGRREVAWPAAAAVECVHAFSLVHDDLPAMDDDDLRRGRPTTHRRFDEATAILAGDALVVLAFEILASPYSGRPGASELAVELARAAGWAGMIGGQAADLGGEGRPPSLELVKGIHSRKTARLFSAACRMGAVAGGAPADLVRRLAAFGLHFGEAFQIADDVLDLTAASDRLGKTPGKDVAAKKQTYPACIGLDESRRMAQEAAAAAVRELEPFGPGADDLRELAAHAAVRDY